MTTQKQNSRREARELFWSNHSHEDYRCPDCGRKAAEISGSFEVHHKDGDPLNNDLGNLVAVCRVCHSIREERPVPRDSLRNLLEKASDGREEQKTLFQTGESAGYGKKRSLNSKNKPDWMNRGHYLIVSGMREGDLVDIYSPAILSYNLDFSRQYITQCLRKLEAKEWVECVERGKYTLTTKARGGDRR